MRELHESVLTNSAHQFPLLDTDLNNTLDPQHHLQAVARLQHEHQQHEEQLLALRKQAEPEGMPTALSQQAMQLEAVLESVWGSLQQQGVCVSESVCRRQLLSRLLSGVRNLLLTARERLTHTLPLDTHTPGQLKAHIDAHTKLFLSLSTHLRMLQHLSSMGSTTAPGGGEVELGSSDPTAPSGEVRSSDTTTPGVWECEVQALQEGVCEVQKEAEEKHTHLYHTLQVWSEWERRCSWLEGRLVELEKQLPIMHLEEEEEEEEEELHMRASLYERMKAELQRCHAHSHMITEHAHTLQEQEVAACVVGGATKKLAQRLADLEQRVELGIQVDIPTRKLWSRFRMDCLLLEEWVGGARERLDAWRSHMILGAEQSDHMILGAEQPVPAPLLLQHYQEFSAELEVNSSLKASLLSCGAQLITLLQRTHTHTHTTATHTHTITTIHTHMSDFTKAMEHSHTAAAASADTLTHTHTHPPPDAPPHTHTAPDAEEEPSSPTHTLSPSPSRVCVSLVQEYMERVQQSWDAMQSEVPAVQHSVQQVLLEGLDVQGVLAEQLAWLEATESGLQELDDLPPTPNTSTHLRELLHRYKYFQAGFSSHQFTKDLLNQAVLEMDYTHTHSHPHTHSHMNTLLRYTHTQFAEELGHLNERWTHLQTTLNTKVQQVECRLRESDELQARLHFLVGWVKGQETALRLAETPSCRSAAQTNITQCERVCEGVLRRRAAVEEMRRRGAESEGGVCDDVITEMDDLIKACDALHQQAVCVCSSLQQLLVDWAAYDADLKELTSHTLLTTHTLQLCQAPPLSLNNLQASADRLQNLKISNEEIDQKWEGLEQKQCALIGQIEQDSARILTKHMKTERAEWCKVRRRVCQAVERSVCVCEAWRMYECVSAPCSERLRMCREQLHTLSIPIQPTHTHAQDDLAALIHTTQCLQDNIASLQDDLQEEREACRHLIGQLDPQSAGFIQSQSRLLSRGAVQLSQALPVKHKQLQSELSELLEFESVFERLEGYYDDWQSRITSVSDTHFTDVAESALLDLSALSPDLDWLNELSYSRPLTELANQRLQSLNRKWAEASAHALERCSALQAECVSREGFEQRCERWMRFLQHMEDTIAIELPHTHAELRTHTHTHQRFQAELSLGHQILHSVIQEALRLLQRGEIEDRSDFLLKLAQLREHWYGAVSRASQQRALVVGLVHCWRSYTHGLRRLNRLLPLSHMLLPQHDPAHCSITYIRTSLDNLKRVEVLLKRSESCYLQTCAVGGQLFGVSDSHTQTQLQTELSALTEHWEQAHSILGNRRNLLDDIMKKWESCQAQLVDSAAELEEMRAMLRQPIPEHMDDMQDTELFVKEVEDSLSQWALRLGSLSSMRGDLSQYILPDDTLLLQEQVDQLHTQWEELCLKVSLRKQEIADRLNAWIIFNEKNKELCDWLSHMESKVAHSTDLCIEDMVEKLKKDCMEEINLFSENKTHLKQLGEQLISASNKTKQPDINDKLRDINDRWQHLFDHIDARVRKLKETLVTVQQLDKSMSNLRCWLSRIEAELAKPVVYTTCHSDEIQKKLAEQQELQRDIEQHTEGVASVLTLCDVLLHDADACGTDLENDSIQQTTHSLDRRWRNICAMSMERRMRIEETWRLWCKFLEDYSRFEDWLKAAEHTAANPATSDVLYTNAKEELKKFEAFQRQVHERLTQLELVNKQYRRLARENRTDASCRLKVMVHEGNQRWDTLQRRVAAILRRLKYFTSQREEFEGSRESVLVWLTEMDLQLTNVEHFSESDTHDKMRQLNAFQQEITLNTNKIDALIVFGEGLIQRSAPLDAALVEEELEELSSYTQEVFGRVARFHHRLAQRRPVLEEQEETAESDLEEGEELHGSCDEEEGPAGGRGVWLCNEGEGPGRPAASQLSGRETPVSVESLPLEWDHTGDVGGSSSHEEEEEHTYYTALAGKAEVSWLHSPELHQRRTHTHTQTHSPTHSDSHSPTLTPTHSHTHSPTFSRTHSHTHTHSHSHSHIHTHSHSHMHTHSSPSLDGSPTHTSTPYQTPGYVRLVSECNDSIESVQRAKRLMSDDELLREPGLKAVHTHDKQPGVIERWELQQAQGAGQGAESLQRLQLQLSAIGRWLSSSLPELHKLQQLQPNTSLLQMDTHIRKLKEMQKTFTSYKAMMISVNVIGRELLGGREQLASASDELKELHEDLKSTNQKWTQACAALDRWESQLHKALMQCQEFHETLHSMLLWLAQVEKRRFNINIHDQTLHKGALQTHHNTLKCLEAELQRREQEVKPLVALCSELLLGSEGSEGADTTEAREKVHVVTNKLRLLRRQVAHDLHVLSSRLESCTVGSSVDPSEEEQMASSKASAGETEVGRGPSSGKRCERSFLLRVWRAAFPLQLLFLLLLVLTCLVPSTQDDYSCALTNNFARSFYPMLRYTNGPPPT